MAHEEESVARSTGKVNWFSDNKGYGFITPDDGGEELFVHQSSIVSDGFRSLAVGESVEFTVTEGSDGKTKAVDVTASGGAPLNKKDNSSRGNGGARRGAGEVGCYACGEVGHLARDCRGGGNRSYGGSNSRAGGEGCFVCGGSGHFARDCRQNAGGSGSGESCYVCGGSGHFARDCRQNSGGSGGGESCYVCGGIGHFARDCSSKRPSGGCHSCGGTGHFARDCVRRGSGGSNCYKCGKEGHFARECPAVS